MLSRSITLYDWIFSTRPIGRRNRSSSVIRTLYRVPPVRTESASLRMVAGQLWLGCFACRRPRPHSELHVIYQHRSWWMAGCACDDMGDSVLQQLRVLFTDLGHTAWI